MRARLWHWKIVHGYVWKAKVGDHINVLEARASLNAIRWRLRKRGAFGARWLHLVVSQVTAAMLTKGRSSSFKLRRVVAVGTSSCSLRTATTIGYVASEVNPADIPARWADSTKALHSVVPMKALCLFGKGR